MVVGVAPQVFCQIVLYGKTRSSTPIKEPLKIACQNAMFGARPGVNRSQLLSSRPELQWKSPVQIAQSSLAGSGVGLLWGGLHEVLQQNTRQSKCLDVPPARVGPLLVFLRVH